jgi:hypothetical protein
MPGRLCCLGRSSSVRLTCLGSLMLEWHTRLLFIVCVCCYKLLIPLWYAGFPEVLTGIPQLLGDGTASVSTYRPPFEEFEIRALQVGLGPCCCMCCCTSYILLSFLDVPCIDPWQSCFLLCPASCLLPSSLAIPAYTLAQVQGGASHVSLPAEPGPVIMMVQQGSGSLRAEGGHAVSAPGLQEEAGLARGDWAGGWG